MTADHQDSVDVDMVVDMAEEPETEVDLDEQGPPAVVPEPVLSDRPPDGNDMCRGCKKERRIIGEKFCPSCKDAFLRRLNKEGAFQETSERVEPDTRSRKPMPSGLRRPTYQQGSNTFDNVVKAYESNN